MSRRPAGEILARPHRRTWLVSAALNREPPVEAVVKVRRGMQGAPVSSTPWVRGTVVRVSVGQEAEPHETFV